MGSTREYFSIPLRKCRAGIRGVAGVGWSSASFRALLNSHLNPYNNPSTCGDFSRRVIWDLDRDHEVSIAKPYTSPNKNGS